MERGYAEADTEAYRRERGHLYDSLIAGMDFSREVTDEEIKERINELLRRPELRHRLSLRQRADIGKDLFATVRGLDVLQELTEDPSVTEIMVNGMEGIYVERAGRLFRYDRGFSSPERLLDVIRQIAAGCNRTVNEANPIVDARLENGSRVNIVLPPAALNGPILTIRRFPEKPVTMEDLVRFGSVSEEVCDFLRKLVRAGYNIMVSGGTGSGKTTFLNALSNYIPADERIITIEDSAELQIRGVPNLVRLETRNANVEGCRPISIRDLIRTSLRMRPDRIIVGEVRGAEAVDLITGALNCGHDGSMSTGHANSASDMLFRLESMMMMGEFPIAAARRQIASGVDIILHLGRLRDRSRKVLQIVEVLGIKDGEYELSELYSFEEDENENREAEAVGDVGASRGIEETETTPVRGRLVQKGKLKHEDKMRMAGILP